MTQPVVVLVNPVSSGPNLSRSFQEHGFEAVHLWETRLADELERDRTATRTMLYADHEATVRQLRRIQPVALMAGAEDGVLVADRLAAELDLPHNRPEESAARRDKGAMLQTVAAAGVPVAASFRVRDKAELMRRLEDLGGFPVVVKPCNSAGGDGLAICSSAEQALAAFQLIDQQPNLLREINSGVLVQEYLDGAQYVVNTVSMAGRHLLTDYYIQRIDLIPGRILSRHIRTKRRLTGEDKGIVGYAMACLNALGVREGAAHTEVRMTSRGPRLLEVNARLMGSVMEPDPYYVAFGYAPQDLVAERYATPEAFRARFDTPYAPKRLLARSYLRAGGAGVLRRMRHIDHVRRLPGFHSALLLPKPGDRIGDPFLATASSGFVYFVHEDEVELDESLARLHEWEDARLFFELIED